VVKEEMTFFVKQLEIKEKVVVAQQHTISGHSLPNAIQEVM